MRRNYILSASCLVLAYYIAHQQPLFSRVWWASVCVAAYAAQPFADLAWDAIKRSWARRRKRKDDHFKLMPRRTGV